MMTSFVLGFVSLLLADLQTAEISMFDGKNYDTSTKEGICATYTDALKERNLHNYRNSLTLLRLLSRTGVLEEGSSVNLGRMDDHIDNIWNSVISMEESSFKDDALIVTIPFLLQRKSKQDISPNILNTAYVAIVRKLYDHKSSDIYNDISCVTCLNYILQRVNRPLLNYLAKYALTKGKGEHLSLLCKELAVFDQLGNESKLIDSETAYIIFKCLQVDATIPKASAEGMFRQKATPCIEGNCGSESEISIRVLSRVDAEIEKDKGILSENANNMGAKGK
jgi:hypothetical protein